MPTLERAVAFAAEAHEGQTDKAGAPYILHVLRVVLACPPGDAQIVAALHDVVEDTDWTLDDLRERGFSETVVQSVDAVTRRSDETYMGFITRAELDPIGRIVKLADVCDNSSPLRMAALGDSALGMQRRYARAKELMERVDG